MDSLSSNQDITLITGGAQVRWWRIGTPEGRRRHRKLMQHKDVMLFDGVKLANVSYATPVIENSQPNFRKGSIPTSEAIA
jgi:hypothetical protein